MLGLLLLLGTACARDDGKAAARGTGGGSGHTVTVKIQRAPRDSLVIQLYGMPAHLNPALGSADLWCERIALHNIFETLFRSDGKRVRPHLVRAFSWRTPRVLRLDLRRGIRFHDGRPLTSADVVFTLKRLARRKAPNRLLRALFAEILDIEDLDAHTVVLRLRRVDQLITALLAGVPILPAHRYRRAGLRDRRLNRRPVGTGPYRVTGAPRSDRLVLRRNDAYWGRRPPLRRVVFKVIAEHARALSALRNGEVDLLPELFTGYYPRQVSSARFKQRFSQTRLHPHRLRVVFFNARHPILKDRRVRVALAHLVNRQQLVRRLRNDLGRLLSAPLWPLVPGYDRTLHPRSYDPKAGAALLDRAGWRRGKDGRRRRRGRLLQLRVICAKRGVSRRIAGLLVKELRAAGIAARTALADFGYLQAQLRRGTFELAVAGLSLRPLADLEPLVHGGGALNYGRYRNALADSLLDAMRRPGVDRVRLRRRLHRVLYEDPPLLVLYAPIELMVADRLVRGLPRDGRWPDLARLRVGAQRGSE